MLVPPWERVRDTSDPGPSENQTIVMLEDVSLHCRRNLGPDSKYFYPGLDNVCRAG